LKYLASPADRTPQLRVPYFSIGLPLRPSPMCIGCRCCVLHTHTE